MLPMRSQPQHFVTGGSAPLGGANADYPTVAYSSAGQASWTNRFGGAANDYNRATAMAADASGNVFVTGYSSLLPNHYTTVAYSAAGIGIWTKRYRLHFTGHWCCAGERSRGRSGVA